MTKQKGNAARMLALLRTGQFRLNNEADVMQDRKQYRDETGVRNPRPKNAFEKPSPFTDYFSHSIGTSFNDSRPSVVPIFYQIASAQRDKQVRDPQPVLAQLPDRSYNLEGASTPSDFPIPAAMFNFEALDEINPAEWGMNGNFGSELSDAGSSEAESEVLPTQAGVVSSGTSTERPTPIPGLDGADAQPSYNFEQLRRWDRDRVSMSLLEITRAIDLMAEESLEFRMQNEPGTPAVQIKYQKLQGIKKTQK